MSLCALIYHNMKGISNPSDLKQIVHICNQLYSKLPTMFTVLQGNYQLEYSASYTLNVHGISILSLKRAFESLISEQYRLLILTVGCIAVSIVYCADNHHFKIFMVRVIPKGHTKGTCILSDISSADNLVPYFQSLYGVTDVYELKGLHITKYN
ncbi:hypothetical protein pdam_00015102 [Pocillopora damicornis]|uniref:Uncharacterized protein n=1 Tax=Pocillopora damicornis TaxID=46731 RepID=A0A3M6UMP3_POCDA|nr:hypothetical protein pdam_00015102 [Pocillopora damicornis]